MTEETTIHNQPTKLLSQVPHTGLDSAGLHSITRLTLSTAAEETRNSSGDEIANVNFLYDDIVHALKMQ